MPGERAHPAVWTHLPHLHIHILCGVVDERAVVWMTGRKTGGGRRGGPRRGRDVAQSRGWSACRVGDGALRNDRIKLLQGLRKVK